MHHIHRYFALLCALVALLSLGAAVAAPKEPPAEYRVGTPVYISPALPPDKLKSAQYSVPNSYFGVTSPSSGSLALGILLGPLGALINAESQRTAGQNASSGMSILSEDLAAMLSGIRPSYAKQPSAPDGAPYYVLTPAATFYYTTDKAFAVNCILQAQVSRGSENLWTSRYVINRMKEYSRDDPALGQQLKDDLTQCFSSALSLFELHKEKGASILRDYDVDFGARTREVPVVDSLLPERLVYFDGLGLFDLDRSYWRGVKPK
jgi:hypothetical protein